MPRTPLNDPLGIPPPKSEVYNEGESPIDGTWLGIERSEVPLFSSKLPKSLPVIDMESDMNGKTYENGQNRDRIENNFVYHPPTPDQIPRYQLIRDKAKELAVLINQVTPASREQSLAFTDLEDCVMHANAAIARNE